MPVFSSGAPTVPTVLVAGGPKTSKPAHDPLYPGTPQKGLPPTRHTRDYLVQVARQAARANNIPEDWFVNQLQVESGFNPTARGKAGERGVAQVIPKWHPDAPIGDPIQEIWYAAKLMGSYNKKYQDYRLALAAYNAGSGNVEKYGGVPPFPTTQRYIANIMGGKAQAPSGPQWETQSLPETSPLKPNLPHVLLHDIPQPEAKDKHLDTLMMMRLFQYISPMMHKLVGSSNKLMQALGPQTEVLPAKEQPQAPLQQSPRGHFLETLPRGLTAHGVRYKITSTTGGKHNVGSKHYEGKAIDLIPDFQSGGSWEQLLAGLKKIPGIIIRDERTRPVGQRVWGGAHIHVEIP